MTRSVACIDSRSSEEKRSRQRNSSLDKQRQLRNERQARYRQRVRQRVPGLEAKQRALQEQILATRQENDVLARLNTALAMVASYWEAAMGSVEGLVSGLRVAALKAIPLGARQRIMFYLARFHPPSDDDIRWGDSLPENSGSHTQGPTLGLRCLEWALLCSSVAALLRSTVSLCMQERYSFFERGRDGGNGGSFSVHPCGNPEGL